MDFPSGLPQCESDDDDGNLQKSAVHPWLPTVLTCYGSNRSEFTESFWCEKCRVLREEPCWQHVPSVKDSPVISYSIASLPAELHFIDKKVYSNVMLAPQTVFGPLIAPLTDLIPDDFHYAINDENKENFSFMKYYQLECDMTTNWMKFVRFSTDKTDPPNLSVHIRQLDTFGNKEIVFVANRAILPHEELTVGYSRKYARSIGKEWNEWEFDEPENHVELVGDDYDDDCHMEEMENLSIRSDAKDQSPSRQLKSTRNSGVVVPKQIPKVDGTTDQSWEKFFTKPANLTSSLSQDGAVSTPSAWRRFFPLRKPVTIPSEVNAARNQRFQRLQITSKIDRKNMKQQQKEKQQVKIQTPPTHLSTITNSVVHNDSGLPANESSKYCQPDISSVIPPEFCCRNCPLKFSVEHLLEIHVTSHQSPEIEFGRTRRQCPVCDYSTCKSEEFLEHISMHAVTSSANDPFVSEEIPGLVIDKSAEIAPQRPKLKRQCPVCQEVIVTGSLTDHTRIHHPDVYDTWTVQCDYCDVKFASAVGKQIHIRMAHEKSPQQHPIQCFICKLALDNMLQVEHHAVEHVDENGWYPCGLCPVKATSYQSILTHQITFHHMCDLCQKILSSSSALGTHKPSHERNTPRLRQRKLPRMFPQKMHAKKVKLKENVHWNYCYICDRKVKLWQHTEKYHPDVYATWTHQCLECAGKFGTAEILQCHVKATHGNGRQCDTCRKVIGLSAYPHHVQTEHPDVYATWSHQCSQCDAKFRTGLSLRMHFRAAHSDHKFPVKCFNCNLQFDDMVLLEHHARNHAKDDGHFLCGLCEDVAAGTFEDILIHQRSVHNICHLCQLQCSGRNMSTHINTHGKPRAQLTKPKKSMAKKKVKKATGRPKVKPPPDDINWKRCNICQMENIQIVNHTRTYHPDIYATWTFSCGQCDGMFPSEAVLYGHVKNVHGRWRQCTVCNKPVPSAYSEHMQKFHPDVYNNLMHECSECQLKFGSDVAMKVHFRLAHRGKTWPIKCTSCSSKFETMEQLRDHTAEHRTVDNQLPCGLCATFCDSFDSVLSHQKLIHFICPLCQQTCRSASILARHHELVHESPKICDPNEPKKKKTKTVKTSKLNKLLRGKKRGLHSKRHHHNGYCAICDKCIEGSMSVHVRDHHPDLYATWTHQCSQCDLKFMSEFAVKAHFSKAHRDEKIKVKCMVCSVQFDELDHLKSHAAEHIDEDNKFPCGLCGSKLCTFDEVLLHQKMVHFTCPICQQTYHSRRHIHLHTATAHDDEN